MFTHKIASASRYCLATRHLLVIDQEWKSHISFTIFQSIPTQTFVFRHLPKTLDNVLKALPLVSPPAPTSFFVKRHRIPAGFKVTNARLVLTIRPMKDEFHVVRVTVSGNCLYYPGINTTQCSGLITTKCLLNITISTKYSKFMVLDIKKSTMKLLKNNMIT